MYKTLLLLAFLFSTTHCTISQYYNIRSQFLMPVNYTGGLCRVSTSAQNNLLTPHVKATDPVFARKISNILHRQSAYFSVSVYDPESGYTINLNQDILFHAASTYKGAILIAIMRLDQDKQLSVKDKISVENQFESIIDGSPYAMEDDKSEPDPAFSKIGEKVTIYDLLSIMIERSSNLAANTLAKKIGIEKINETLKAMGSKIVITRGVSDEKAYAECINNLVSARELEKLYRIIYSPDLFDEAHKQSTIEILKKNSENSRIAGNLPNTATVAHKAGNTSKVFHDAGVVIPESGSPYYITLLTSGYKSGKKIADAMAEASLLIYHEISKARISASQNSY